MNSYNEQSSGARILNLEFYFWQFLILLRHPERVFLHDLLAVAL